MVGTGGEIVRDRLDYQNLDKNLGIWENLSVAGNNYEGTLLLVAEDMYRVQLRAATRVGLAQTFSQIIIPPRTEKPPVPDFIVEAQNMSDQSLVTWTWGHPRQWTTSHWRNLTSYTVYWCQGYPVSQSCKAPIEWETVPVTMTTYTLLLEEFETYLFSVAVNADTWAGETISSGITWNQCTYRKNHKPEVAPTNVRFSPYQPSQSLGVEWDRLTCRNTYAYIQHYIVHVCESPSGSNCTGAVSTFTVDNAGSQMQVPSLKAKRRYKVWVVAASSGGVGPDSDALYGVVIDRSLNAGEISGIVIGSVFVVIIFFFGIILCTRRIFRMLKQRFEPIPIEVPPLPPLPPIPMPPPQSSSSSSSSDSSGTLYEKIDGPPSPSSSSESTTGVDAPLINSKWKLTNIKYHIYGKRKEARVSSDSGRGSLSQSADTLLMTLHPPHGKKTKKTKIKHKSESDSGVIIDNRGHAVCCFTNSESKWTNRKAVNTGEVNPYSCVDIVNKINTMSEQLKRKTIPVDVRSDGCENSGATYVPYSTYSNGSTMSLPPVSQTDTSFLSQSMASRTKSADDQLDFEENKLASMIETSENISSYVYSADDSPENLNVGEIKVNVYENQAPVTSYVQVADMETCDLLKKSAPQIRILECDCSCHSNAMPVVMGDGYVKQEVLFDHDNHICGCEMEQKRLDNDTIKTDDTMKTDVKYLDPDLVKVTARPVSQVMMLPPHFYGSLTLMETDPANTTEL